MRSVARGLVYVLANFATPIVFFISFQKLGAKPAISFALLSTFLQVIFHLVLKMKINPFFVLASGFTVLFGGADLLIKNPMFYKFEPFTQNLVIALALGILYLRKVPVLKYFVEALPPRFQPDMTPGMQAYLHKLTLVWIIYLLLKAVLFYYWATHYDLGTVILLRSVVGGGTLILMLAGEYAYRLTRRI